MKPKFLDSLGRVHIPKEYREALFFSETVELEMEAIPEKGELVIRKRKEQCMLCENTRDLLKIKKGFFICKECICTLQENQEC